MLDRFAKSVGLLLMILGLLGFMAPLTPHGLLFNIFRIDPIHNMVHLVSGALLFSVGFSQNCMLMRRVVLFFATVYGVITILGFFLPVVFGMHFNMPDNILHLAVTTAALIFALPEHHIAR